MIKKNAAAEAIGNVGDSQAIGLLVKASKRLRNASYIYFRHSTEFRYHRFIVEHVKWLMFRLAAVTLF